MIISRTPFRISFFGGGTDFPEFFNEHGGATLSTTINKYCYISVHELSPFFKHRYRASYARTESVQTPEEFQHPLVRECLLDMDVQQGLEISHVSDLPGRTGLGTSSSFTVGLLHALYAYRQQEVTALELAEQAIHIERTRVGDPGGHQDQYAAAYGGLLRQSYDAESVSMQHIELTPQRSSELLSRLMLFYTGVERTVMDILHEQKKGVKKNIGNLKRMLELVDEAQALLTSHDNINRFGELLNETWQMKRALANGITNSSIDEAYQAGRDAGAIGGKLLGAGGRGFLLLFAETEKHPAIREALKDMMEVPFAFSNEGSRIIFRNVQ
jgi:D-glycero-alpha-D-manno-heptose-7-phosphate kinase